MVYTYEDLVAGYCTTSAEMESIFANKCNSCAYRGGNIKKPTYEVDHIVFGNPVTVVHWADGTRTVVKCQKSYEWNAYTAFCAALAKKVYGNNTKVCEIVEKKDAEYISSTKHMEKQKKIAETKAAEAKARAKRIKKMAKRMRE